MKITGQFIKAINKLSGTSKAGKEWEKMDFLINTGDEYNPEVCINVFGADRVSELGKIKEGTTIDVDFNIVCREYQGKYYTNLQAYRINPSTQPIEVEESPF